MKTAIVSGASGGIGSAIAKKLSKSGYTLALIYNKGQKEIEKLKKELSNNPQVFVYKCDLTNELEIERVVSDFVKRVGRIDCLVNCAGVSKSGLIQNISEDDYKFIFDSNIKSTIML